MITCTSSRPADTVCGECATVRVTITGADRANHLRPTSYATPWNLDKAPRCNQCANMDRRIVERLFTGAHFESEPIGPNE